MHNTNNATQLLFSIDNNDKVMKSDLYDFWEVTTMSEYFKSELSCNLKVNVFSSYF